MNFEEVTDPAAFLKPTLRDAARRFGVKRYSDMTKADLVEALGHTAWSPAAEAIHTYLNEHHPKNGQPPQTCAVCFRPRDRHSLPTPSRFGWPSEWRWPLGEPFRR
ncbi:hypothetical protein ACTOB_007920 [Actinoplanes oblitus]|uniref:Rho termination factor N-terminal domain-containing protein n=1 Tax=Actinoplanes oblitus TaxID=3040509 RepID=A0ABY8WFS3_9ACTN|nr:hypothetical protein [Actinoplanes oblitus]WIM95787.1 hypothetical protein ACTOB_007920 [Actinoplanes oblitus]